MHKAFSCLVNCLIFGECTLVCMQMYRKGKRICSRKPVRPTHILQYCESIFTIRVLCIVHMCVIIIIIIVCTLLWEFGAAGSSFLND